MMLAKSVLEEKSELLDRKEFLIRQLRSHNQRLEAELEELRGQSSRREGELERGLERARREGIRDVVEAVVCLAADYEGQEAGMNGSLAARLVRLLDERYALEVLSGAAGVQVLRSGFRLEGKLIRPALVEVAGVGRKPAPCREDAAWKR
jgi:hypothetical protein